MPLPTTPFHEAARTRAPAAWHKRCEDKASPDSRISRTRAGLGDKLVSWGQSYLNNPPPKQLDPLLFSKFMIAMQLCNFAHNMLQYIPCRLRNAAGHCETWVSVAILHGLHPAARVSGPFSTVKQSRVHVNKPTNSWQCCMWYSLDTSGEAILHAKRSLRAITKYMPSSGQRTRLHTMQ